jgi:hypothetical protein
MGFPTSPTNGQTATVNGVLYTYNSTLTAWTVGTEPGANLSGNNINVTSSAAVGTTLTVTGATTLSSTLGVTGTVTGGNVLTGGLISATGNVSGGNVLTGGLISATGNVSGGNLNVTGNIVDTAALSVITGSNGNITLSPNGTGVITASSNVFVTGLVNPSVNNTYDLGTASLRWRNIYTNDLQLNNGIGDYTIVEGEDDLFLYNNKKGKVYKFALIEVDPTTAPPKAQTD